MLFDLVYCLFGCGVFRVVVIFNKVKGATCYIARVIAPEICHRYISLTGLVCRQSSLNPRLFMLEEFPVPAKYERKRW